MRYKPAKWLVTFKDKASAGECKSNGHLFDL
ncbi:hypothetical protein BN1200_580025 [Klebsiella variicola]|nr:hypothetical protein KVR801_270003 [Klebsiella variicola]CEP31089.1 hypothetical protein KV8917_470051 [Klebsiella variicola]CTP99190.1 hypothetical protein BN1007_100030 [Klebsiella variicola]CTQ00543.1 hypothetical protein BN1007_100119 [Klebsiella variicola]CTQ03831.1 hypothetical protein BN1200_1130001 [Klebsiella variicola]